MYKIQIKTTKILTHDIIVHSPRQRRNKNTLFQVNLQMLHLNSQILYAQVMI